MELFDITYVRCGDIVVDKQVEEAIEKLSTSLEIVGPDLSRGQLLLSFYEIQKKKSFLGMISEEKIYWEQWVIPVLVNTVPRSKDGDTSSGGNILSHIILLIFFFNHVFFFLFSLEP